MKKIFLAFLVFTSLHFNIVPVYAQDCQGPAEMCTEISELQAQVSELKSSNNQLSNHEDADVSGKMAKSIAIAGAIAVFLKMLMSVIKSWKGRVHTDKDKAIIRIATLGVSILIFIATNIGMGMSWWQSVIIAGGGPGAIAFHEVLKLIPVLQGKQKLKDADPEADSDSDQTSI